MTRKEAKDFIVTLKEVRNNLSTEDSVKHKALFPQWSDKKTLNKGDRVNYKGQLYQVRQQHTTQKDWNPEESLTLFEPLDIINEGTISNPILAATGMVYQKNKYYLDSTDNNIYKCIRDDTGNGTSLYYSPCDLSGLYFEKVEG